MDEILSYFYHFFPFSDGSDVKTSYWHTLPIWLRKFPLEKGAHVESKCFSSPILIELAEMELNSSRRDDIVFRWIFADVTLAAIGWLPWALKIHFPRHSFHGLPSSNRFPSRSSWYRGLLQLDVDENVEIESLVKVIVVDIQRVNERGALITS